MIRPKEPTPTRRAPPPVLNGKAAEVARLKLVTPKRKPPTGKHREGYAARTVAASATAERECPTCKRPFPMTPAERQRKRRAKLKKGKR